MHATIRSATVADVNSASGVLAAAFADDPVMTYIWPDRSRRLSALPSYFAIMLRTHHLDGGGVDIAVGPSGAVLAAAAWDPPHRWQQPIAGTLRALPCLAMTLGSRARAALTVRRALDRHHPEGSHWYLCQFGTTPNLQGHGIGRHLLAHRLAVCDADGTGAYLVSNRSATIPLYRSVGFDENTAIRIDDGLHVWPMTRPPRRAGDHEGR